MTQLEDLSHREPPADPAKERRLVMEATQVVRTYLEKEQGVAVHCDGGTGRTGSVIGRALVDLGFQPDRVRDHLDLIHKARGRSGWPESEWQFEVLTGD